MENDPLIIATVIATGLTALGTLGLAVVTFYLARTTGAMAEQNKNLVEQNQDMVKINRSTLEEMKKGREAQERPYVAIELDYEQYPMLHVLIRNLGRGPAVKVDFAFYPELETPKDSRSRFGGEYLKLSSMELPLFTQGIDLLSPGARISLWWGATDLVVKDLRERGLDRQGIKVEIIYESLGGEEYQEETFLNPAAMGSALYFQPPSLSRLVDPVVNAAEKLDKAIDEQGYLKIKTATELRFEKEAEQRRMAEWIRRETENQ